MSPGIRRCLAIYRAIYSYTFVIVLVLSLYFIHVIYAVLENRFLFGDGVHFFINLLEDVEVFTGNRSVQRLFANILTQAPALLAIKIGVNELQILSIIYGASLFLPYLVCVTVWLWSTRRQKEYLLFLFVFLFASAMNSEFFIISESHAAAALYFSLIPLILFKEDWGPGTIILAVILAAFTLRSYESMLFLGPILAAMALSRGIKCHSLLARLGWSVFACWFAAGAVISLAELVYPAEPQGITSSKFAGDAVSLIWRNMFSVLTGSTHLHYAGMLSLLAIFLLCVSYIKSARIQALFLFTLWAFAMACAVVLVLHDLFPAMMEVKLHYKARTLNVAIPALTGIALILIKARIIVLDANYFRRGFAIVLILGVYQSIWHMLATSQWAGYLNVFANELDAREGFVPYEDSILKVRRIGRQSVANMSWGWTMPEMSIVLSPHGVVETIIGNPRERKWQPFDPLQAGELPDLSRYGIKYSPYLESLRVNIEPGMELLSE